MDVGYSTRALETQCTKSSEMVRKFGAGVSKALKTRLLLLRAAEEVGDLLKPGVPGRWELLTGDRKGQLSARLTANWRLIVEPQGEGAQIERFTVVHIVEIVDYH